MEEREPMCAEEHHHTALTERVRRQLPDDAFTVRLSEFFKIFGDSTRLRILAALDRTELCVCDLADLIGMTKSAVSHQLAALRAAHLVTYRRDGKNIYYALADDHVRSIIECAEEHLREPD
jgi:ArsR family transcriptional regulator